MTTPQTNAVQGKYGWYPCDLATYKKIKAIKKAYYKSQRKAAAWYRWARKSAKNRKGNEPDIANNPFCRLITIQEVDKIPWRNNSNGKYLTYNYKRRFINEYDYVYFIPAEYETENKTYTVAGKTYNYIASNPTGNFNHDKTIVFENHGILFAYKQCMPVNDPSLVGSLGISFEEIDRLFEGIKE